MIKVLINNKTYYIDLTNRTYDTKVGTKYDIKGDKHEIEASIIPKQLMPKFKCIIVAKDIIQDEDGNIWFLEEKINDYMEFVRFIEEPEQKLFELTSNYLDDYKEKFLNQLTIIEDLAKQGCFLTPTQVVKVCKQFS